MRFTKMHGAGNDYVYVDCFNQPSPTDPVQLAIDISHRRFGVGADGLILIEPSQVADARMRMFNADGSESEMCGNGIRCVAKFVHDHDICRREQLSIETGGGLRQLKLQVSGGKAELITVDMGQPQTEPDKIPNYTQSIASGGSASHLRGSGAKGHLRFDGQSALRHLCSESY